jgi:hypothetical protein
VLVDLSAGSQPGAVVGGMLEIDNFTVAQMTAPSMMVVCFAAGTQIATPQGPRPVEALRAGDMVRTLAGPLPLRTRYSRRIRSADLCDDPALRPVLIRQGALGPNCPSRDLRVSQQHRILVNSAIARRLAPTGVLVAAHHLTALPDVSLCPQNTPVTYVHLAFDHHSLVWAEGCLAESFLPGDTALAALPPVVAHSYQEADVQAFMPAAPLMTGKQARRLVARHLKNGKPLQQPSGTHGSPKPQQTDHIYSTATM